MDRRPNILLVITDQQQADAMACAGNPHLRTPHLDALAARGIRFTRAYTPFPLCSPARASMFTGRMPHQVGFSGNHDQLADADRLAGLGHHFARHGWDCAYAGKWHIDRGHIGMHGDHGFRVLCGLDDHRLPEEAAAFLRAPRERPFLLVCGFDDPHNICEWSREQPLPWGEVAVPAPEDCPPLPANFPPPPYEAEAVAAERALGSVYRARAYRPDDWRRYRHAYFRLVERIDAAVGRILAALAASGHAEDTLVVFTSDHGDGAGAHEWNQKSCFYEESVRVPLIVAGTGVAGPGRTARTLVNAGIDLLPTLCGAAGLPPPRDDLPGIDLGAVLRDPAACPVRPFVVSETRLDSGPEAHAGRMLRSERFKYSLWQKGRHREQLVDLDADPGEMVNLAVERRWQDELQRHRELLWGWLQATGDRWMQHYARPGTIVPPPGIAW